NYVLEEIGVEDNFIDYQITYANFTSDTLKTVVVIDTIQLNHDLSYIQELGKSHNAELQAYSGVPGSNLGVLVWRFNDINLPPKLPESETNDHRGYIAFRIGLSSSLSSGTTISNRAGVIMDYYEQESTNTVYAVVNSLTLSVEDNQKEQYALKVYPNPVRTKLFIHNTQNDEIRSVRVYSSKGQLVLEKNRFFDNSIDLSSLISGVYFISLLNTSNKYSYSKVIKID
ncbi:MAG: T9SS type A sorting domain-containing protein, partial [Bacteroidia bacterium]